MGTDIHLQAEVWEEDHWVFLPGPVGPCPFCDATGRNHGGTRCWWCDYGQIATAAAEDPDGYETSAYLEAILVPEQGKVRHAWYEGRNYTVFATLADVRNNWNIVPIAEPRGFPDDLSPETVRWVQGYDHTPSWLGLEEILRHPWGRCRNGFAVAPVNFASFHEQMHRLLTVTGEHRARLVFWFDS